MTQSVELTLDAATDAEIRDQWRRLAEAGLPSAQRAGDDANHRPHVTVFAGDHLPPEAEEGLRDLATGLHLQLGIGPVMLFGPRRMSYVVVRAVTPSTELLAWQQKVAGVCGADPGGQFGPGRWTPHVTLARRMTARQVAAALEILGPESSLATSVRCCRRWDSERRVAWWLTD